MDVRLQTRGRILKTIDVLERLAAELLEDYERALDAKATPADAPPAVTFLNPFAPAPAFEQQRRDLIESMPNPHTRLFKGEQGIDCTCPRYHNGLRRETDPLCPLHAGDARD